VFRFAAMSAIIPHDGAGMAQLLYTDISREKRDIDRQPIQHGFCHSSKLVVIKGKASKNDSHSYGYTKLPS
jgi:hypothetical protein